MFNGIHRLEPGHFMLYKEGHHSTHRYWQVDFPSREEVPKRSIAEWEDELFHRLEESVRLHLRSDVEVGAWLSPGLDSSSVVAMARRLSDQPLRAFTLSFEDANCDERRGQRTLGDFPEFAVDATEVSCESADFGLFPRAVWHTEDPTTAGLEVPRMLLAEAASESVKVVITGEGSDEVFGGYPWYSGERMLQPLARLPQSIREWIAGREAIARRWPGGSQLLVMSPRHDLDRFCRLIGAPNASEALPSLVTPDIFDRISTTRLNGHHHQPPDRVRGWHWYQQLQYHDLALRLPDAILHRVDRISMAHSLEVRVPFLDHELVDFCAGIPPALKHRWMREKYILRRAVRRVLPKEIVSRAKRGLRAPYTSWFDGQLPDFADELLSSGGLRDKGYFESKPVQDLLRQHGEGCANAARVLLGILAVQLWDEIFVQGWRPSVRTS
jgi:asparagine synthase (glutamine-hydrolysing)